jgi:hypothetical protein
MKQLTYDLNVRTKGRPPSWVPSFMRVWFIWDKAKRIKGSFDLNSPDFHEEVEVLGGAIILTLEDWCLQADITYAGLEAPLVGVCLPDGHLAVKASAGGFSVQGNVGVVDA